MSQIDTDFAQLTRLDGDYESDTITSARLASTERIRILVADPDPLARRALADSLREDQRFFVIGQASSGVEAFELTRHYAPALVLLAAHLPGMDAVALCERIAGAGLATRVVMLATGPDLELEMRAIRAGASGFVVKSDEIESIARSLAAVNE